MASLLTSTDSTAPGAPGAPDAPDGPVFSDTSDTLEQGSADPGDLLHLGGVHFDEHSVLHEAIAVELAEDCPAAEDDDADAGGENGEASSDEAPQEELEAFDPENPQRAGRMRTVMPAARFHHPGGDAAVPAADKFIGFKHAQGRSSAAGGKPPLIVRALARVANTVNHGFNLGEMRLRMDGMHTLQTTEGLAKGLLVHRNVPYKQSGGCGGDGGGGGGRGGAAVSSSSSSPASSWKHRLDVYLPAGPRENLKTVIHFHGGGWRRGDRQAEFQGAPAISRAYALAGFVCFAPSYRLGQHTQYIEDARDAVVWALAHAAEYGADPTRVFLSGHSAGGNIATLLAVSGEWLPPAAHDAIQGVVGMAGVYSVLNPLGGALTRRKNKTYDKMFRTAVFGNDLAVLARHSPTALLRLSLGETEPFPKRECQICHLARHLLHKNNGDDGPNPDPVTLEAGGTVTAGPEGTKWRNGPLPAFLLMNAQADVGLEADGARMTDLLKRRQERDGGPAPAYSVIPSTNHTTLAWDVFGALPLATQFVENT